MRINQIQPGDIDYTAFRDMINDFKDFTLGRIAVRSDSCTLQKQLCIPTLILLLRTHNIFQLGLGPMEINIRHFFTGAFYKKSCRMFQMERKGPTSDLEIS